MASSSDTSRLFRVRPTVMQMLRDRGYAVADADVAMTERQFLATFGDPVRRDELALKRARNSDPSDQICVFFTDAWKPGVKAIRCCLQAMHREGVSTGILVVQHPPTAFAMAAIREASPTFHLEVFQESELAVDVKEHTPVPEHMKETLLASELSAKCSFVESNSRTQ